jgi:two-component system nitrogen regulation sensor histidine kinase GlnL
MLRRRDMREFVPFASPLVALVEPRCGGARPASANTAWSSAQPRLGLRAQRRRVRRRRSADEAEACMSMMLQERTIADKMDRQLTHRGAARSVVALGAMLAHEIKNPLVGHPRRGAASREQSASEEDRLLTRLICDEADRIVRWSTAWRCSATSVRSSAGRSTSIRCSIT